MIFSVLLKLIWDEPGTYKILCIYYRTLNDSQMLLHFVMKVLLLIVNPYSNLIEAMSESHCLFTVKLQK